VILMAATPSACFRRSLERPTAVVVNLRPERRKYWDRHQYRAKDKFRVYRDGRSVSFMNTRGYAVSLPVRMLVAFLVSPKPILHIRDFGDILYDDHSEGGPFGSPRRMGQIVMQLRPEIKTIGLDIPKGRPCAGLWIVDLRADQAEHREAA
jgi:hypothetical protein